MTMEGIAALIDVNVKTERKAIYSRKDTAPKLDPDGLIPADAALAWLQRREDFWPSIW